MMIHVIKCNIDPGTVFLFQTVCRTYTDSLLLRDFICSFILSCHISLGEEADVTAVDEALRNMDTGLIDEEKFLFEPLPALGEGLKHS